MPKKKSRSAKKQTNTATKSGRRPRPPKKTGSIGGKVRAKPETPLTVFVSHAHEERELANAWKALLTEILPTVQVFFSSDRDPAGGIGLGRWQETLTKQMQQADCLLLLLTPDSAERSWVLFETGFGRALCPDNRIVPLRIGMAQERIPEPVRDLQSYSADQEDDVRELVGRIADHAGKSVSSRKLNRGVTAFVDHTRQFQLRQLDPQLFRERFHSQQLAKNLEGRWFIKWVVDQGLETLGALPIDELSASATESRLRFVCRPWSGAETALEGRVSLGGHVVLTWWAGAGIQACGTLLLEVAKNSRRMEGTWQGFAAFRDPYDELVRAEGRVVIARDRMTAERRFGIRSGSFDQSPIE